MLEQVISGLDPNAGGGTFNGNQYVLDRGVLRCVAQMHETDDKLAEFYAKHWNVDDAYDFQASESYQAELFKAMFSDQFLGAADRVNDGEKILDFGCGTCVAGRVFFGEGLKRAKYFAVDMSGSIDRAKTENEERGITAAYVQATLDQLPFDKETFDTMFCPGVLHYTRSISESVQILRGLLKPGGRLITWFYKKQAPIRQLTDDYLREYFSKMNPEEALEAIKPLTKLGISLGELGVQIDIAEDIDALGVKKGTYDLQRFFYYFIMKLFHHPDLTFMRHAVNNWNAYYPASVLFTTEEEAKSALKDGSFDIEYFDSQGNGMAIVAVAR